MTERTVYHLAGQNGNGQMLLYRSLYGCERCHYGRRTGLLRFELGLWKCNYRVGKQSYCYSNGNLQIVLATGNQNIGPPNNLGAITLKGTKVSNARVLVSV